MKKNKKTIVSLFSGIGGIDLGFEQTKKIEILWQNEFDKYALETLKLNSNSKTIDDRDILEILPSEIPQHDILVGGFPCQPFSLAGNKESFNDPRGKLIFKVLEIVNFHTPEVVFLENVKNLKSINNGKDLLKIISELEKIGYFVKYKVLNTFEYSNLPQNRERLYIIAFKNKINFDKFVWPKKTNSLSKIEDILESNYEDYQIYNKAKNEKIYNELSKIEDKPLETFYQWRRQYIRRNQKGLSPTLTANMGTGGHNVPLIKINNKVWRKLSPRETLNLQGYPKNYKIPQNISKGRIYKQVGNSVSVPIIFQLANKIIDSLN